MKQPEVIIKSNKNIDYWEPKRGNIVVSKLNRDFILLITGIRNERFDGVYIGKSDSFGMLFNSRFISDYEPFEGEITFKI